MGVIKGNWKSREVTIDGEYLSPIRSQNVVNHSPDGFLWGYGGSGPAQLALAILLHFTNEREASAWYQDFKWDVVARLPQADFEIPTATVIEWLKLRKERAHEADHRTD